MKPRRRLLSVDLLPTISETQEDAAHAWHPGHAGHCGHPSASLEDYVASIKELAQPAAFSASATLRGPGRPKHALPAAPPPGAAAACKPRLPVALDDIALVFAADAKRDCGGSCSAARDPLDWLFARAEECDDRLSLPETSSAALCLL